MNHKPLIRVRLEEIMKESPDLSFGEILYSVCRKQMLKQRPSGINIGWLTQITDAEFYTAFENALNFERENK